MPACGVGDQRQRGRLQPGHAQHREVVLAGRTTTACASSPGWRPRSSTRVSFCPATTCALVTTSPAPATQPEPSTPEPARVAEDLHDASPPPHARPPRARSPRVGAGTRASGPSMRGNGSSRASASISPLDGGSTALRCCRIVERWTSRRASPPLASASAPSTQAIPSPTHGGQHRAQQPVDGGRPRAIAPGRAIARPPPRSRARRPSPRSAPRPGRRRATRASGAPRRAAAGRRACPTHAPTREADQRERPRDESLRPAEQGQQQRRRPRSASRCPSRPPSVPAAPYESSPLTSSTPRPRPRDAGTRSPTPAASPRSPRAAARRAVAGRRDAAPRHVPAERKTAAAFAAGLAARRRRGRCTRCCPTTPRRRTSASAAASAPTRRPRRRSR